jgi:hypothetical protein
MCVRNWSSRRTQNCGGQFGKSLGSPTTVMSEEEDKEEE